MAAPLVIAGGRRTAGRPGGRAAVLPTPASGPDLIVMPHTKPLYLRVIRRADYVQRRADCATAATLTSSLSKQLDAGGRHRPRRGAGDRHRRKTAAGVGVWPLPSNRFLR